MQEAENLLEFAEEFIYEVTNKSLSDLQRTILLKALQGERITYENLASECGYSAKYLRQDIAPKLWHLLSDILGQKVVKSNVRSLLEREFRQRRSKEAATAPGNFPTSAPHQVFESKVPMDLAGLPPNFPSRADDLFPPPAPTKETIMIVDDRPQNLKLLSDVLSEQGYRVRQATSGPIALQAISLAPPALILLDIQMPEMDGYSVCQRLKENPETRDIPVIFISALDEPWDKVKAFSVGGVDYIAKPFKLIEVIARVENHLRIRQLQKTLQKQNLDLQQALLELRRLAAIDPGTQLASRRRFDAYLQQLWSEGLVNHCSFILILCCVEGFAGPTETDDYYLQQIARTIKAAAARRPEDLTCHYEGTTFAVILPNLQLEVARAIATAILAAVNELDFGPARVSAPEFKVSIGGSMIQPKVTTENAAQIDRCDRALREAKQQETGIVWVEYTEG